MKQSFFLNADGKVSELFSLINCIEKIEYYFIKDYFGENCWFAFCDDINLYFCKEDIFFGPSQLRDDNKWVNVKKDRFIEPVYKEYIELSLLKDKIIGIQTRFELLQQYKWEIEAGPHTGHVAAIVRKDSNYYYMVDSKEILDEKYCDFENMDHEVFKVPIEEMELALNEFCVVYRFELIPRPYNILDTYELIKAIWEKYKASNIEEQSTKTIYNGKAAYMEIYLYLQNSIDDWERFFETHWYVHLVSARRKILLNQLKTEYLYYDNEGLLESLNNSISAWEKMKGIIMRHNVRKINKFRKLIINAFENICTCDYKLFDDIELWLMRNAKH